MSDSKWTKEQLEAITESGCNLLVAAAAGAGKTAVLVERIIRKITDSSNPIDIDRLLVVTFTNAAATEMRERIGVAVAAALEANPGSRKLQRQLTLLNKAHITTIHSFCLEVIRNNFHRIDLDPGFRIADETEAVLMKQEILEELFEEKYEVENLTEDFVKLVECFGGSRDDRQLQDMVLTLYEFIQSHPWPEEWLNANADAFNITEAVDFGTTPWGKVLMKSIRIELEGLLGMLANALSIIDSSEGLEPYRPVLNDDIAAVSLLLKNCGDTWDGLYKAFADTEFGTLARCGKDADKIRQEQVKGIRNEVKSKVKKIKDEIFMCDSADVINDLRELYPVLKCLSRVVGEFGRRYSARKREKSLMDFSDLEHCCLEILTKRDEEGRVVPSDTAFELRKRFDEILVDEYQDSNLVQEVILGTVSRKDADNPNVFMVGDVKQSIYRFRQARPELFLEKYNTYSQESGKVNRKIQLYRNFRSRVEVINAANYIFKQLMTENIGELDYDDSEALNPGSRYEEPDIPGAVTGGAVELHIINTGPASRGMAADADDEADAAFQEYDAAGEGEEQEEQLDAVQAEARLAALRIRELMEPADGKRVFHVFDKAKKAYRPLEYKDIVILLRTTRNWSEVFAEEMAACGIPVYADSGTGYFRAIEIQTIMSLLQIIDNPMQDIPLLAVLRSPIGGFTPEELIDIRLADREATFFEAMKKFVLMYEGEAAFREEEDVSQEKGDAAGERTSKSPRETVSKTGKEIAASINDRSVNDETVLKAARLLSDLERWRDKALHMSTDELIWFLYSDTGYYSFAGAMSAGAQRQANLRMLFERARQYEETSYKGLFNFINFINRLKSSRGDMGSAKILGENENVVRIMSIHKSKGLEFPVVIVAGCGKQFNLQDMNRSVLLHQDLGFGPDYVDPVRRVTYPTVPKQALKYKIRLETLSEEMRILYVALTRAREKLILTGSVKNAGKTAAMWCECCGSDETKLPEYKTLTAKCYLDWIGTALARHEACGALRDIAGMTSGDGAELSDPSEWEIRFWDMKDVTGADNKDKPEDSRSTRDNKDEPGAGASPEACNERPELGLNAESFRDEIERRLGWQYSYGISAKLPTKISVTELKRCFNSEAAEEYPTAAAYMPPLIKKPAFLEAAAGLSPAEKGTAMHFVMQHIKLDRIREMFSNKAADCEICAEIEFELGEMVLNEQLTEQQSNSIDVQRIADFFNSSLGNRMLQAEKVYREMPFNMEVGCREIYRDLPEDLYADETILLQGVIDCFFEDGDGIIMLDYKTDFIPKGNYKLVEERYATQIRYYAMALERLTGRKVREKYIYLFCSGDIVKF